VKNKKLNIVLYVNSFLPNIGGKQFVVYYLAGELHKLGHKVRVVGPSGVIKNKHCKFSFQVHRLTYLKTGKLDWKYSGLTWIYKFREIIRFWALKINVYRFGGDIIHAHLTYPNGYLAVRLSHITNIPVVITPHGEDIRAIPELGYGFLLNPELKKRIEHSLKGASALTAISKSIMIDLLKANANKDKIRMIPNGVDIERFSAKEDIDIKDRMGIPKNSKLITTIGQYHPRKGHDILIKSMSLIVKLEKRARLLLIGKSDESLQQLTRKLDLDGYVIFAGEIQSPTLKFTNQNTSIQDDQGDLLASILQNSELYVSAGIEESSEGMSLALLEAMAASLPVVASKISGNKDIVIEGKNGLLVTPGCIEETAQAILKILLDDEMRKKMSANAISTATEYDWIKIAKQYESLYRETIEEARRKIN
jgi:glycosyltransferase involved in cell wall biosynthesis